jgi:hypothetical protein
MLHVLAPGSSSFYKMAESRILVDKSHAIIDFIQDPDPVHLVLRARRSGKTTLLRLFRAFFERVNPAEQERRKKLFVDNQLAITQSGIFEKEFGRYPVLYVDLSNVNGLNMEMLVKRFRQLVRKVAGDVKNSGHFNNSSVLDEDDRTFIDDARKSRLDEDQLPDALYDLTRIVEKLTNRRVIVLIDEYDTPISHAIKNGYSSEADELFRAVFSSLLKGNEHIRGALIMGILRVAKASWVSGINNMQVFPLDADLYSEACMFTEDETRNLYAREATLRGDGNV